MEKYKKPTSDELYKKIQDMNDEFSRLPVSNESDLRREFTQKVDNFEPQYQEMRDLEARAYSSPAREFSNYDRNSETSPSAFSKLNTAMSGISNDISSANVMGDIINAQRGNLNDLVKDITLGEANKSNSKAQQLQTLMGLYSQIAGEEMAQKSFDENVRQFNEQMNETRNSRSYGGGGSSSSSRGQIDWSSLFGLGEKREENLNPDANEFSIEIEEDDNIQPRVDTYPSPSMERLNPQERIAEMLSRLYSIGNYKDKFFNDEEDVRNMEILKNVDRFQLFEIASKLGISPEKINYIYN